MVLPPVVVLNEQPPQRAAAPDGYSPRWGKTEMLLPIGCLQYAPARAEQPTGSRGGVREQITIPGIVFPERQGNAAPFRFVLLHLTSCSRKRERTPKRPTRMATRQMLILSCPCTYRPVPCTGVMASTVLRSVPGGNVHPTKPGVQRSVVRSPVQRG
jgi:hypothetical protein